MSYSEYSKNKYLHVAIVDANHDFVEELETVYFDHSDLGSTEFTVEWEGVGISVYFQHFEHGNLNLTVKRGEEEIGNVFGKVYSDYPVSFRFSLGRGHFIRLQSRDSE